MAETVYILGAGVNQCVEDSAGLKPPLARNLFETALKSEKYAGRNYSNVLRPVHEYVERSWNKDRRALERELFDLEELFTKLDDQRAAAQRKNDRPRIAELLRTSYVLRSFFAEFLAGFENDVGRSDSMMAFGRLVYLGQPTVISFNYDCIVEAVVEFASRPSMEVPKGFVERALHGGDVSDDELSSSHFNWNRALAYGTTFAEVQLQQPGPPEYVGGERFYGHPANALYSRPILKLHGSLNWFRYLPIRAYPPRSDEDPDLPSHLQEGVTLGFHLWHLATPPVRNGWMLEPVLITPVSEKQPLLQQGIFVTLWERARTELANCRQLIIIGYSFPETDDHSKRLLTDTFADKPPGELIVVNPDRRVAEMAKELCHFNGAVMACSSLEEYLQTAS